MSPKAAWAATAAAGVLWVWAFFADEGRVKGALVSFSVRDLVALLAVPVTGVAAVLWLGVWNRGAGVVAALLVALFLKYPEILRKAESRVRESFDRRRRMKIEKMMEKGRSRLVVINPKEEE